MALFRRLSVTPTAMMYIRNLYGLALVYLISARGAEAAPLESTTMFMFVLIGNAVTMAVLQRALWPEGG